MNLFFCFELQFDFDPTKIIWLYFNMIQHSKRVGMLYLPFWQDSLTFFLRFADVLSGGKKFARHLACQKLTLWKCPNI